MHKYAAVTALAIALITMLTLTVSASLTPANARFSFPPFKCNGAKATHCMWKCENELWSTANLWDGTRNHPRSCPPSLQACIATCAAAKNAAQHEVAPRSSD
jgi:hypothetical protein